MRCSIEATNGIRAAYVKKCTEGQLVREVIGNLLARELVAAPRAYIVRTGGTALDHFGAYAFATDAEPTMIRSLEVNGSSLAIVLAWPRLPVAIALDTWLANGDRSMQNILFLSRKELLLIDHGESIPDWMTHVDQPQGNLLAGHYLSQVKNRNRAADQILSAAANFADVELAQIPNACAFGTWSTEQFMDGCLRFLDDRRSYLTQLVHDVCGSGQQGLKL